MEYTHQELRIDVVHYIPDMIRLGLLNADNFHRFDTARNAYVECTVQEWQTEMIQAGHYMDEVFVRTAAELLGRQIILYPVIPNP